MKQINDNQYAAPYKNAKKVAIAINDKTRQGSGLSPDGDFGESIGIRPYVFAVA